MSRCPSSMAMIEAVEPYLAWVRTTAGQCEQLAASARAAAAAFELASRAMVFPAEVSANRTLLAELALYHREFRPFAVVPVAAASREQAEIMVRQAEGFVLRSDRLYASSHSAIQAAKGKRTIDVPRFVCLEGYRRINHHGGGRIQVFAADDRTGDGIIPTLGIIDEPHRAMGP